MTQDQFRTYATGLPMQHSLFITGGDVFNNDNTERVLKYPELYSSFDAITARLIIERPYNLNGEYHTLTYEYPVFSGGEQIENSINGIPLPITPVTLKDLLVASLDYREVFEQGEVYFYIDSKKYRPGEFTIIAHYDDRNRASRHKWLPKQENTAFTFPASLATSAKKALKEHYEMINQIVRPHDRFMISIIEKPQTQIRRAILVNDNGRNLATVIVNGVDVKSVDLSCTSGGNRMSTPMESGQAGELVALYESLVPSDCDHGSIEVIVDSASGTVSKLLTPLYEGELQQVPPSLAVFQSSLSGANTLIKTDKFKGKLPFLSSFHFVFGESDGDRKVQNITIDPHAEALNIAFNDGKSNTIFQHDIVYTLLEYRNDIVIKNTGMRFCDGGQCQITLDRSAAEQDGSFVLSGFTIHGKEARPLKNLKISERSGVLTVGWSDNNGDDDFSYNVRYAYIPNKLLGVSGKTLVCDGYDECTAALELDGSGPSMVQGFEIGFIDSDRGVNELGFKMVDNFTVEAHLVDKDAIDRISFKLQYASPVRN